MKAVGNYPIIGWNKRLKGKGIPLPSIEFWDKQDALGPKSLRPIVKRYIFTAFLGYVPGQRAN